MKRIPRYPVILTVLVSVVALGGCSATEGTSSGTRADGRPGASGKAPPSVHDGSRSTEQGVVIRDALEIARPGGRVVLLEFRGVGRLVATCARRPRTVFKVENATQAVGVSTGGDSRVRNLNPGQPFGTRLSRSALQRWHIASRHGDGDRTITASVQVAPVVGGRGQCMFSAQSIRTGRIP
jgi:hypothetical protein